MIDKRSNYAVARVAVNVVILTFWQKKLWVYVTNREKKPYSGLLELPGGLLQNRETAEETLKRKMDSWLKVKNVFCEQFYTFTEPRRDPRTRTISVAFVAMLDAGKIDNWADFYQIDKIKKLAFDHKKIVDKALGSIKSNLDGWSIQHFFPKDFPINDLQVLYELISGKKVDNRNFRKRMINLGLLEKVEKVQKGVAHRPAKLYRFVI
jgi:8-oxo-dGTP diphosphatase